MCRAAWRLALMDTWVPVVLEVCKGRLSGRQSFSSNDSLARQNLALPVVGIVFMHLSPFILMQIFICELLPAGRT